MPNILYHARYPALIVFIASVIFADFQRMYNPLQLNLLCLLLGRPYCRYGCA